MKTLLRGFQRWGLLLVLSMLIVLGIPAALSADASIPRKEGGLQSFPVEATTQIYKGAVVCLNTSGYLVAGADTNGYRFAGIAYENVLGTTQGALNCRVYTHGVFKLTCTSITQAMVGRLVYVTDDATVDESSSYYVCVGRITEYVSTTQAWVDIGQRGLTLENAPGRLYAEITSGSDELGAVDYGELHVAGTSAGHTYGRGSWINIDDAAILAAGHIHVPWEGGVYEAAATMTNARIVFGAQCQAILTNTPASLHCWRLNTTKTITALIAAANSGSVGYVANATANSTKLGDIPLADIAGGVGVVYVRVYGVQS